MSLHEVISLVNRIHHSLELETIELGNSRHPLPDVHKIKHDEVGTAVVDERCAVFGVLLNPVPYPLVLVRIEYK